MFGRLGIRAKTLLVCLVLSSFTGLVGTVNFIAMSEVVVKYEKVASLDLPKTRLLAYMWASFREVRIGLRTLGIAGISPAESEKAVSVALKAIGTYEKTRQDYERLPMTREEKELFEQAEKDWASFKRIGERVLTLQKSADPGAHARMAQIFFVDCPEAAGKFLDSINALIDFNSRSGAESTEAATAAARRGNQISLTLLLCSMVLALVIGYYFARSLAGALTRVAERLQQGAGSVTQASTGISNSSQALSTSVSQQAAALQETASSLEQISSMVSKSAENAKSSTTFSTTSESSAQQGKAVVGEVTLAIAEIDRSNTDIMAQIEASNREIGEIVKVITEIGAKTKVINDIVFQTKLLSFNASVEAARAGEHGKGFAVVAEEIGNLAQMSGNAAKEISSMLDESVKKVESIVDGTTSKVQGLVATGKAKVEHGAEVARRCGEVLDEIVQNIAQVRNMANEISSASQEQASGIREINKAMGQLDQVTQQNSSAADQTSESSKVLAEQARELRESISSLLRTVHGEKTPPKAA